MRQGWERLRGKVEAEKDSSGVGVESPSPVQENDSWCGETRFGGGGPVCYQPKGHRPPHIFECESDDDE